jgi:two-component system sensor histidine kinase/response regulator
LSQVKTSADALLQVINDILDFSKIEARKLELNPLPFRLRDTLDATMKTLALQAHQKGLELLYAVHDAVSDGLIGDTNRLCQVLVNLVGNAIKFTEHGEIVVDVANQPEAPAHEPGEIERRRLHFVARNTGIGIPPNRQQGILEPFVQPDGSTTRQYGGTGLGLTISKQLIELVGGQLWIESQVGRGSTFHFTICCEVQPGATTEVSAPPVDVRGLPVLVVDDNATNRRLLHALLEYWQMKPTAVDGGQMALQVLAQARDAGTSFPLVLLDAQMPGLDGFAVAARMREDPSLAGATILMLSSADLLGDAARCRALGIRVYLTKPVRQADLRQAIVTALSSTAPAHASPAVAPAATAPTVSHHYHILLAEDNPVNQMLGLRMLEKQGHAVVVVANGREALTALARESFDLVLMDVQMPIMDGFEATAAIRAQEERSGIHLPRSVSGY